MLNGHSLAFLCTAEWVEVWPTESALVATLRTLEAILVHTRHTVLIGCCYLEPISIVALETVIQFDALCANDQVWVVPVALGAESRVVHVVP